MNMPACFFKEFRTWTNIIWILEWSTLKKTSQYHNSRINIVALIQSIEFRAYGFKI